ncbi:unnamed protein product [Rotaria socialis]|uniref:Uncharacterized protein n=2 Tax=Rotaria socialis TaxID=392032 RepID=A0A818MT49_9BILA|nr:unnamed protein product [Rotaria socialis]CAF3594854.1 unnamed protein product [Rotaria socialis]
MIEYQHFKIFTFYQTTMLRFFVFIAFLYCSCEAINVDLTINIGLGSGQNPSPPSTTTKNPYEQENSVASNDTTNESISGVVTQLTTVEPIETNNSTMIDTSFGESATTIESFQETSSAMVENTLESLIDKSTVPSTTSACPSTLDLTMLDDLKNEIINTIISTLSRDFTNQLAALEARLSTSNCYSNEKQTPKVELNRIIYESLIIPLNGWTLVFNRPYSHRTRTIDLAQIAGICRNEVIVAATVNGSIILAAVGPASVLTTNTTWNQPQQFGDVFWYRTPGKSFGFAPTFTIRQTQGDNEDLSNPLRLSWLLDQDLGGYRVGATRSLTDSSIWYKTIYCS